VKRREFLATPLALAACAAPVPRDTPGPDGWAAAEGEHRVDVRGRADLDAALALGDRPKLLRVHGRIDLSQGRGAQQFADPAFDFDAYCRAYSPQAWGRKALTGPLEEARKRSASRQSAAVVVKIPPRTAIVGATPDAGFRDGALMVERTHDVALRNLHFDGVRDHFPAWDPLDGREGEWNSEYDAISLRRADRIWVDHCSFRSLHPARERIFGRIFETNDGLLDITVESDLVTVSWCRFSSHDKTMLIGGSDRHEADEGHLRVSLHHNLWEDCAERTPRVRYGRVHVANNLFIASDPVHYGYSIGLGRRCNIVSEANAWELAPGIDDVKLLRNWGGTRFSDRGSIRDGKPVDLAAAFRRANPAVELDTRPAFEPPPVAGMLAASEVPARVRAGAGAGNGW
jgi:pectate lyase